MESPQWDLLTEICKNTLKTLLPYVEYYNYDIYYILMSTSGFEHSLMVLNQRNQS